MMLNFTQELIHFSISAGYGVSEPYFIILMCFKFIWKTESEIIFYTFSSWVIIEQEWRIIIEVQIWSISIWSITLLNLVIPWYGILPVCDVFTSPEPCGSIFLKLSFGEYARLHSHLVKRGSFGQIENIEFNFMYLFLLSYGYVLITNFKVIPLSMSPCVSIVFKP